MNEHDSEKMAAILDELGMSAVSDPDTAEVLIINTCAIREKAEHKVYSALGKFRSLKTRKPDTAIIVAGCVAQQEKNKLFRKAPHLDAVVGTHHISELPRILEEIGSKKSRITSTDFVEDVQSLHTVAPLKGANPVCSFLTIMQGCSNFCTYCVVPFTRGPEQSRHMDEILEDTTRLVGTGIREITLLGQNVNAYGKDLPHGRRFADLLKHLDGIPGLARIRFTTSHPRDFDHSIIAAMANLDSVCEHIHLPLQSGSDRILSAMHRGYSFAEYLAKVESLRDSIPHVAMTTDIIVGFPGETEADFIQTLEALERIRYDQIFSFKYSSRPSTAAQSMPDHIPESVKIERLSRVHELQGRITEEYHRSAEGSVEEILVEGIRPKSSQVFGRTRTNKIINLEDSDSICPGELVRVRITEGLKHSLRAVRAD
jgi:tRNA-2-methylthio-N6-dimethylallyladenosine synthase